MTSTRNSAAAVSALQVFPSRREKWFWLIAPVVLFFLAIALTTPPFAGDSFAYCRDVARVTQHAEPASTLWEPGHVLWRPLGYVLSPLLFAAIPDSVAWTPELKIGYGYMLLNLAFGMLAAVLIADLCRRLGRSRVAAGIAVVLFVCADGILAYSQSGSSYVVGLGILAAGLWWHLARPASRFSIAGPAVLFGLAALVWLPYVIAIPAACCARKLYLPADGVRRDMTWLQVLLQAAIAGGVAAAGLALATVMAGIRTVPAWTAWMLASGHGMHQNRQGLRAITGCSRLFIDLGSDGIYLKRFLFHDPYHPVGATSVIAHCVWRPALFFLFLGATVLLACRSRAGRRALAVLALAGLPALAAAIFVFEPSSPERFFPVLPFLLLTIAAAWQSEWRWAAPARAAVCLFAVLLPVMNAPSFVDAISGWHREAQAEAGEFRAAAAPNDALVALLINEPIVDLPTDHAFDRLNRAGAVRSMWALDLMDVHAERWPGRVARFVTENWAEGRGAWVEKAALADRPANRLLWVEGDNPRVHWRDVPAFFRTLEFDKDSGGRDGFLRIAHSAGNEKLFQKLAAARVEP